MILNLISFETEANLSFNVKAVRDGLEKEPAIRIVSQKKVKAGDTDGVRMEYLRGSNRMIQYLLVKQNRLWSLLFICPKEISAKIQDEIGGIANSFRIEAGKPQ